jgi:hypothetical protein
METKTTDLIKADLSILKEAIQKLVNDFKQRHGDSQLEIKIQNVITEEGKKRSEENIVQVKLIIEPKENYDILSFGIS